MPNNSLPEIARYYSSLCRIMNEGNQGIRYKNAGKPRYGNPTGNNLETCHERLSILTTSLPVTGKKRDVEELWRDFFSNISQWWDHRPDKINPRYPDFKHKQTGQALWLSDSLKFPWVQAQLAAIPPGTLDSNCFAWAQKLKRYVKAGQYQKTMEVFHQMQEERVCPDTWTFLPVLNACAGLGALEEGKRIHMQIIQTGCDSDVHVANGLVDMYAKCGSMEDAWSVFDKMLEHNVVSWSAMIGGYVRSGKGLKAMELFWEMQQKGVEPNAVTFVGMLNACASVAALEAGRCIHEQIIQRDCESDVYVATCLVDMYAKCGSIGDAWSVFNKMQTHNVVSWSAMIGGFVKAGQGLKAMELFWAMQQEGVEPNSVTFVAVLNACASVGALDDGRHVHQQIIKRGCQSDVYVANGLVDMFAKCGSIVDAWSVFDKMGQRTVVSWSSIIWGCVKSGQGLKAIDLFQRMQQEGVEPDPFTFVGTLNACASVGALEEGRRVHEHVIQKGCESDIYVANCLVDMYSKCRSIEDAWSVFDKMLVRNVVSWSSMIGGYAKSGQGLKAIELFRGMQQEGVEPNAITFVGVLNACASIPALEEGRHVHDQVKHRGLESDVYVANCLVDMYAKCGSMEDAWSVFNKMLEHDVVSWSAMIGGYVKSGQMLKAMELFRIMQEEGVEPNTVTFVGVLNACAALAAVEEGRQVHKQIIQRGCESDLYVASCLVDMYAKCGSIEDAWGVFKNMRIHSVVSWNALIGGYAMHGAAKKAIELFKQLSKEGVEVDGVTFTGLLSACNHGGLVTEGLRYFKSMTSCFFIVPTREHYGCMVDLLARAGMLDDAEEIMKKMAVELNASLWRSVLGACKIHGNVKVAEQAAKHCLQLDPGNASSHVLLSNVCIAGEKWDQSAAIEEERLEKKISKEPGRTWIEVNNVVHSFAVTDKEHPEILEICAELERLVVQMNEAGYIPDKRSPLYEVKEGSYLCCHTGKLAIAYGLISTPPGTALRITTNVGICRECHGATKFIANMVGRVITLKDANCFHRFQSGICSCKN